MLVLMLLLTGCATAQNPGATPTTPSKGDPVPVTVEKTGGFAGVKETITVDETGKWTKAGTSGRLTVAQSQQLQLLASDTKLAVEAAEVRPQTKCRDSFEFAVTVGNTTVRYVDCPTDGPPPAVASQIVSLVTSAVS